MTCEHLYVLFLSASDAHAYCSTAYLHLMPSTTPCTPSVQISPVLSARCTKYGMHLKLLHL